MMKLCSNWSSLGRSQLSNLSDLPCCVINHAETLTKQEIILQGYVEICLRVVYVFGGIVLYLSNTTHLFLSRKAELPKWWWTCHGDWLYPRVFPVLPCPVVVWSQPVLDSAGWRVKHIDCWGNLDCTSDPMGLQSLSRRGYYCKISWSLEAAGFGFRLPNRSEIWQAPRKQRCWYACQFKDDTITIKPNLAASRLHEILR